MEGEEMISVNQYNTFKKIYLDTELENKIVFEKRLGMKGWLFCYCINEHSL